MKVFFSKRKGSKGSWKAIKQIESYSQAKQNSISFFFHHKTFFSFFLRLLFKDFCFLKTLMDSWIKVNSFFIFFRNFFFWQNCDFIRSHGFKSQFFWFGVWFVSLFQFDISAIFFLVRWREVARAVILLLFSFKTTLFFNQLEKTKYYSKFHCFGQINSAPKNVFAHTPSFGFKTSNKTASVKKQHLFI